MHVPTDRQWHYRSPGAFPFTGICAIDGSSTDPNRRLTSRGGSAVAVPTSASTGDIVVLHGKLYATYPFDDPESEKQNVKGTSFYETLLLEPLGIIETRIWA